MLARYAVVLGLAIEALVVLSLLLFGRHDPQGVALRWYQLAIVSLAGIAGWAMTLIRPSAIDRRVVLAIAACLLGIVTAAISSPHGSVSWSAVWNAFAVSGTCLLFCHQASSPTGRRNLLALLVILFVLIVVAYLVVVASLWWEWLQLGLPPTALPLRPANIGGILAIPTWFGDAVVVTAPLAASVLWATGRAGRAAAVALLTLAGIALLITATRSIWLLLPVGAIVVLLGSGIRHAGRVSVVVIGVIAAGVVGVAATGASGQILRDVDAGRSSAFSSAVQLFLDRPIVGGGPGTYGVWRLNDDVAVLSHRAFPNAHNLPLNTLAETGVIGFGLWLVGAVLVGSVLVAAWRRRSPNRAVVVAAIAGLSMILGHAMVDVVVEQPGLLMLTLMVGAIAFVPDPDGVMVASRRLRGRELAGLMIAVVVLAVPAARVELGVQRLVVADSQADAVAHLRIASEAAAYAGDLAPIQISLAAAAELEGDLERAFASSDAAYRIEGTAQHRISMAWLALRAGDAAGARAQVLGAVEDDRLDPFVLLNAVVLLDGASDAERRAQTLTDLIVAEPAIRIDGVATDVAGLATSARSDAVDVLIEAGNVSAALVVALVGGDVAIANEVVLAFPEDEQAAYATVVAAWFGDATARAQLFAMTAASPEATFMWFAWHIAAAACDVPEAVRWRRAHVIETGQAPVIPTIPAPGLEPPLWPTGYPQQVWRVALPTHSYVDGTWTYDRVSPDCMSDDG